MKVKDLHGGQLVSIVIPYNGLKKGLKGTVLGYYQEEEKVLLELFNRQKTQEKVPVRNLIGVIHNE